MQPSEQVCFDLFGAGPTTGYDLWREQRRQALKELSRKMGLPLGRKVEIWLRNDIRLLGVLRLREEQLFIPEQRDPQLELTVDNVPFVPGEMKSCVVLD